MFKQNFHRSFRRQRSHRIKYIDPRFFVQKANQETEEVYEVQNSFESLKINEELRKNIFSRGYTTPTPIQDQAINPLLSGRDVVGIASTGTGKTAAFLVPLIDKVLKDRSQKVLIITPTRELAVQIEEEFKAFSRNMNIYSVLCIGGVGMFPQIKGLRGSPNFVIGTPGRLRDLERQGRLSFSSYKTIVLDEVDRMLDMGFIHEVRYIMGKLSAPRQSLFFSATLAENVKGVMQGFLNNPVMISVKGSKPSANVEQDVVRIGGRQKIDVLHDLLISPGFERVLVFGRTKWGMEKLSHALSQKGHRVAAIHGNKKQSQRQRAITDFKENRVKVLLATDVASRGLDIDDITHVINYDQPQSYEDYIHRIGRTGRINKKGIALTFID